jgi:DNA-cytosine methyltransferase
MNIGNVLSLFDGCSCGQIALNRAGIEYNNYYASEIDKYAIKVTQANYPNTIQLGDIIDIKGSDLPEISLIMGGAPCQGFSFAGKQLNFEDPRSKLFFEFVRLLEEIKPSYFLFENVKMKKEYQDIISSYLKVEPIEINSSFFSAQNRKRLYWTNIKIGLYADKGILLKDILEDRNDIPVLKTNRKIKLADNKSNCLDANYYKGLDNHGQRTGVIRIGQLNQGGQGQRIYSIDAKSVSLSALGGGQGAKTGLYLIPNKANVLRCRSNESCNDKGLKRVIDKKIGNLIINESQIRKLTPIECEKLQNVPFNYTNHVSNSQRYRMLGNGWTVDVIAHILKGLKENQKEVYKSFYQMRLF